MLVSIIIDASTPAGCRITCGLCVEFQVNLLFVWSVGMTTLDARDKVVGLPFMSEI